MIMLHVTIAIASLIVSIIGVTRPLRQLVRISYVLIAGTVMSGVALVAVDHTQMLHVCISGFSYLVLASILTVVTHRRIERQTVSV